MNKNIRKLSKEEQQRLFNKYNNVKYNSFKMIEHEFNLLNDLSFVMLAVLEEKENNFSMLCDSHPMTGHGGTPHIIDSSYGRMRKKQCEKHDYRMRIAVNKVDEQKKKINNYINRFVRKQKSEVIGKDGTTKATQEKIVFFENCHELAKKWNQAVRKKDIKEQEQIKKQFDLLGVNIFESYGNKFYYVDGYNCKFEHYVLPYNNKKIKDLKKKLEKSIKSDIGKTDKWKLESVAPELLEMEKDGKVTQWKKRPEIFFIKGYKKVALSTFNNMAGIVKGYAPSTNEERAEILDIIEKYQQQVANLI